MAEPCQNDTVNKNKKAAAWDSVCDVDRIRYPGHNDTRHHVVQREYNTSTGRMYHYDSGRDHGTEITGLRNRYVR